MTKPKKNLLIVSIALFALFFVFTLLVATVDKAAGNAPGTEIGFSHLNLAFFNATHKNGEISNGWYKLTEFLGYLALAEAAGFAVYGVAQLIVRKSLKKIDKDLFVLAAAYVLLAIFYVAFEKIVVNYRPVLENGKIAASYPSSHTMLTITIASTGIFMLRRRMTLSPRAHFRRNAFRRGDARHDGGQIAFRRALFHGYSGRRAARDGRS